jgi:hypothetical protein
MLVRIREMDERTGVRRIYAPCCGLRSQTYEEVMAEYDLDRQDILAALDYAAKHLSDEEIRAVGWYHEVPDRRGYGACES